MNVAFGMNLAAFGRVGGPPSQAQVSQQIATTGAASAFQAQQDKMKACNAEAGSKALKGDERKKFMSDCLKAEK